MSSTRLCETLELPQDKCKILQDHLQKHCRPSADQRRVRSRWQECIASRRKGKPFDPEAIKALAEEYRKGKCP